MYDGYGKSGNRVPAGSKTARILQKRTSQKVETESIEMENIMSDAEKSSSAECGGG
jgi:hypothetical protein